MVDLGEIDYYKHILHDILLNPFGNPNFGSNNRINLSCFVGNLIAYSYNFEGKMDNQL